MKKMILFASSLGIAIVIVAGYALAQDHPEHPEKQPKKAGAIKVTLEGKNFCLACALKKEKGAAAQCSVYGHRGALEVTKVSKATASGQEKVPDVKGWILHYLDNENSQDVIGKNYGKIAELTGTVYTEARVLEVDKLLDVKSAEKPESPEHPDHPQ